MEDNSALPTAASYQALFGRAQDAIRARAAGEIDTAEFRLRLIEIDEEARTLDLLSRLSRMAQHRSQREQKPPLTS